MEGFKNLSQAQLLNDVLYYAANDDNQQWLIYYISRPLIGILELMTVNVALLPEISANQTLPSPSKSPDSAPSPQKKDVRSFGELLNNFPMIARQMQPGLERLFKEFGKELGKPLPPPPSRTSIDSRGDGANAADENGLIRFPSTNGHPKLPFNSTDYFEDEEDLMRRALETAVTAAIDLFQLVDKQQLSFLGATTDLTGPVVERLIERYVVEQVHDSLLFPRLCGFRKLEDQELDRRIRHMENIDVSQVGIAIEGGRQGKEELNKRLSRSIEIFRKMGVAGSPQEMLEILLDTEKAVTDDPALQTQKTETSHNSEKHQSVLTVNADVLVSLLLMVVIRSQVRHLQARLSYMQKFIYIDDVESGEIGYALSTFEAVLSYLNRDSAGLRSASARNKRLWMATKTGNVGEMREVLNPHGHSSENEIIAQEPEDPLESALSMDGGTKPDADTVRSPSHGSSETTYFDERNPQSSSLSHVFPFETWSDEVLSAPSTRKVKKVSMDMRSLSGSSVISFKSRTTTLNSISSGIEGDTSIESLTKTQDPSGNSIPMMAIEARQPKSLRYLLSLEEYYPMHSVLEDCSSEGTTLLSAAVQLADDELIDIVLDFVSMAPEEHEIIKYLAKADSRGRTMAHYLFNAPRLLPKLMDKLPWKQKDKIGQTPLFALCRSYDHPEYSAMVIEALAIAKEAQGDEQPLRIDEHVDHKGNTLLHIINDPRIINQILHFCDADPNAFNDRKFTPLMLASKYGKVDTVRVLFGDPRVDINLRELRGLTAVELAKDDEVRNRIDDLTLFNTTLALPGPENTGRLTSVVRSFFVEDATVRFILKSGAPNAPSDNLNSTTYTITTCRRSLADFENLARWLTLEHPASYMVNIFNFRNPFQIHCKPSRAVLHYTQTQLDWFIRTMLGHPTFATHEMLWEFFLVPDMQAEMMEQRAKLKAQLLHESIAEEYETVTDVRDIEQFIYHSKEMVRSINAATHSIIKRSHALQHAHADLAEALTMSSTAISILGKPANTLPRSHITAFSCYTSLLSSSIESSLLHSFTASFTSFHATILAILSSLTRPSVLVTQLNTAQRALSRNRSILSSQSLPRKFNFPGLEESRLKGLKETEKKIESGEAEIKSLGKELRWTRDVVAGELAGWTEWRERCGREVLKDFVRGQVVKERERGKGLERCLRTLREAKSDLEKEK